MTVRQFAYLAVGALFAWIFFFIIPLPTLLKWPLSLISIGLGASFAFVPVDGRPLDVMFLNFIRAIFAPTQYFYSKDGSNLKVNATSTSNQNLANPVQAPTPTPLPQAPATISQNQPAPVINLPGPTMPVAAPIQSTQPQATPLPSLNWDQDEDKSTDSENKILEEEKKLDEEQKVITPQLEEAKANEPHHTTYPQQPFPAKPDLEEKLNKILEEKQALERELQELKSKISEAPVAPSPASQPEAVTVSEPIASAPNPITEVKPIEAPAPLTQTAEAMPEPEPAAKPIQMRPAEYSGEPNLLSGVLTDPRGNPLQNILVEVLDKDELPVRAFKTNAMGKFASATPLNNGEFVIKFEDPKLENKFDEIKLTANGSPIAPLSIKSIDQREELRRELFN